MKLKFDIEFDRVTNVTTYNEIKDMYGTSTYKWGAIYINGLGKHTYYVDTSKYNHNDHSEISYVIRNELLNELLKNENYI